MDDARLPIEPSKSALPGPTPKPSVTLDLDKLVNYVEIDLWSRFQSRLWKIVAAFGAVTALAGLLGIPYYIKSEIRSRLETQSKAFSARIDEIAAYAKVIATLQTTRNSLLYEFNAEVMATIPILQGLENSQDYTKPSEALNELISNPKFSEIINSRFNAFGRPLSDEQLKLKVGLPRRYMLENQGFNGAAAYAEVHPVLDGTLAGVLQDLKFRALVIVSIDDSISRAHQALFGAGGVTDIEQRTSSIRALAIEKDIVAPAFSSKVKSILSGDFLTKDEKDKFSRIQVLYMHPSAALALSATPPQVGLR